MTSVQIIAIILAFIIILSTLAMIFLKTNGSAERSHLVMIFIGFMCLCVSVGMVPGKISFGENKEIVFIKYIDELETKTDSLAVNNIALNNVMAHTSSEATELDDIEE